MAYAPRNHFNAVRRMLGWSVLAAGMAVSLMSTASAGMRAARLTLPLSLSWRYTATYDTNNPASPTVSGDTVYFACGDRMYALDVESGSLKWRYPDDQPLGTRIRTTPAIMEDMLYFGADDGKLYALNAKTGKGTWLFDTRTSVGSTPTVADGIVYFGAADGRVYAIDTRTGAEVPTWKGGFKAQDEIAGFPVVSDGIVYVISMDQVLHAIGAATGKTRFSARLGGTVVRQSPAVHGDYVFAIGGSRLHCFMKRNLVLRWTVMLPNDAAVRPVVDDTGVYVVTADNTVLSFDVRTSRPRWKNPPRLPYEVIAAPTLADGYLFVGTVLGAIYAIDVQTGEIRWVYKTQPSTSLDDALAKWTNIAASPVVADGRLFVLSDDGTLSAFDTRQTDTTPPEVTIVEPAMGVVINGVPPIYFEARIFDEGSGVNPATVRLLIDGEGVPRRREGREYEDEPGYYYDLRTGTLTYATPEPTTAALVKPLPDGRHTVTVMASDWAGNTVTRTWSFTVDNSVAKLPRRRPQQDQWGGMPGGPGGPGGSRLGGSGGRRGGGGGGIGGGMDR